MVLPVRRLGRTILRIGLILTASRLGLGAQSNPDEWAKPSEAIGDLSYLSPVQRAAFAPNENFFAPLRAPQGMDWLASYPEPGQTVEQYQTILPEVTPRAAQTTLALLPLGEFGDAAPSLEALRSYCAAFFGMTTVVMEGVPLADVPAHGRLNPNTRNYQLKTPDILGWLPSRKPANCYALIAVTMTDLYPADDWNFVFGQALRRGGAGVFSFARYDPTFGGGVERPDADKLILKRSCKVLAHEMGHMFGLKHCVFFHCLMNGANHLAESDAKPMHVCPVCLRKLQMSAGFGLVERGQSLLRFYQKHRMEEEADWMVKRVDQLSEGMKK